MFLSKNAKIQMKPIKPLQQTTLLVASKKVWLGFWKGLCRESCAISLIERPKIFNWVLLKARATCYVEAWPKVLVSDALNCAKKHALVLWLKSSLPPFFNIKDACQDFIGCLNSYQLRESLRWGMAEVLLANALYNLRNEICITVSKWFYIFLV